MFYVVAYVARIAISDIATTMPGNCLNLNLNLNLNLLLILMIQQKYKFIFDKSEIHLIRTTDKTTFTFYKYRIIITPLKIKYIITFIIFYGENNGE